MRFVEDGPNIPPELLRAQDEGRVVLFCGSGVSRACANLPDFFGLTRDVLDALKVPETDKLRKRLSWLKPNDEGVGDVSADQIFDELNVTFDVRHIHRAVAQSLAPKARRVNLSAHKTLLRLAKQQSGNTRLVTTNFDLLFEACDDSLKSSARSTLPRIQFLEDDWGIVHLHGRVTSDYSGSDSDGFVLSSAEFGNAYLAQGWARDFVKEILDRFTAVFVGYSAEDPPIQYLLKGMQQSNSIRHGLYAFQSGSSDKAEAHWDNKGVEAISYDNSNNHEKLWKSLQAWAEKSSDPSGWRSKVFSMARRGPARLKPHERGMVANIVSSTAGALAFRKEEPPLPAEWLCVFDPVVRFEKPAPEGGLFKPGKVIDPYKLYSLDDDPPPSGQNTDFSNPEPSPKEAWSAFSLLEEDWGVKSANRLAHPCGYRSSRVSDLSPRQSALGEWIAKIALEPACVWWAARQSTLHPEYLRAISYRLERLRKDRIQAPVRDAWRIFFLLQEFPQIDGMEFHDLQTKVKLEGWSPQVLRRYSRLVSPQLKSEKLYSGPRPPLRSSRFRRDHLIRLTVEYPNRQDRISVPNEFLADVSEVYRKNLEISIHLENELSRWFDLCAIIPDENYDPEEQEFSRGYGISGYTLGFAEMYERLVKYDPARAKAEFSMWRRDNEVFQRLRLWAVGIADVASDVEFAEEIISLDREFFWSRSSERDLLVVLARRWNSVPMDLRGKIEKKLLEGPKRYRRLGVDEHRERSAHHRLNRLFWLKEKGCTFEFDFDSVTDTLRANAPNWQPRFAKAAAETLDGRCGWVQTKTDCSALRELPISKIIEVAESATGRGDDFLTENDPFKGLCSESPLLAISSLNHSLKSGKFIKGFWEAILSRENFKEQPLRLSTLIAGRLTQVPSENFREILLTASRWFEAIGQGLKSSNPALFDRLWSHFIQTIVQYDEDSGSSLVRQGGDVEWATEAINAPAGNLAELTMLDPAKDGLKAGQKFSPAWLRYVDQLLNLPGDSRRFALVIFSFNMNWFFTIDPEWAKKTFLDALDDSTCPDEDKEAIWAGFMWGARIPHLNLYKKLKPHLLAMARERRSRRRRHGEILSGILLAGWISKDEHSNRLVTDDEMRSVLLEVGDEFRSHTIWQLDRWTEDQDGKWSDQLFEFLTSVWPKQKHARTAKISARLCDLAFGQKKNFPQVAHAVAQLISPIEAEHAMIPAFVGDQRSKSPALNYPRPALELLYVALSENPRRWPYGTSEMLLEMAKAEPSIREDPKFVELLDRMSLV